MSFLDKFAKAHVGSASNLLALGEAGSVSGSAFSGSPKKATITLTDAQPNATYSVTVTGEDARTWTIESRTTTSFVINANANEALTGLVFWQLLGDI